jgi:hypothetical protein
MVTVTVPLGTAAPGAAATGVLPGSFSYKLHAPVPLLTVPGEFGPYQLMPDVGGLFSAPFAAQAGEHADLSVTSALRVSDTLAVLDGTEVPEDVVTELPPGAILDLGEVPPCPQARFVDSIAERPDGCPASSQVGVASVLFGDVLSGRSYPLYKLAAADGHLATLGFPYELISKPVGVRLNADLRADGDYGITLSASAIGLAKFVPAPFLTIWGVPAAGLHDPERWNPQTLTWGESLAGPAAPLVANGADCEAGPTQAHLRLRYWTAPERWLPEEPQDAAYSSFVFPPEGCDHLSFAPSAEVSSADDEAGAPGSFELRLRLPRDRDPDGLEAPPLAGVSMELPEGMSVNPAVADGLAGCTAEEIGLDVGSGEEPGPAHFSAAEAECPAAAKVGDVVVDSPLAEAPLEGEVYVATPFANPFGSLLALYLVIPGPGFTAKFAVEVKADPDSGRLVASLTSLPSLSIDSIELSLAGGPRAPLAPPPGCGEGSVDLSLAPASAPSSPVPIVSRYAYSAPDGPGCAGGSRSELTAGSTDPSAGGWSPFVLRLRGADIGAFKLRLPPGLLARVRGVGRCGQGEIESAEARQGPGEGEAERADPSCPASSRVGSLWVEAGPGPHPLAVSGSLYLAGPFQGSPFSLVAITPALAGGTAVDPLFDLGTVVDRVALDVDPRSGALSADAGALPSSLDGIPLRIATVSAVLDRPGFVRNPSNCANMAIEASARLAGGATGEPVAGFRPTGCERLDFAPRLRVDVLRGRRRAGHPTVRAVLRARSDEAAIRSARLVLPASERLEPRRLGDGCHAFPLARGGCPRAAISGHATAWSGLLDKRLEGPVYLRTRGGGPPELVLALAGRPRMEVAGEVRAGGGRVSIDFPRLPDAELRKLVVSLWGGRWGFLANTRDLCASPDHAIARLASFGDLVRVGRVPFGGGCQGGTGIDRKSQ